MAGRFARYGWLPASFTVFIMYMSLLPGGAGVMKMFGIPHFDKVLHFGAYACMTFLWYWAIRKGTGAGSAAGMYVFGVCLLLGCLLEAGQYWMHAGRSFEALDMVANGLGALAGIVAGRWLRGI